MESHRAPAQLSAEFSTMQTREIEISVGLRLHYAEAVLRRVLAEGGRICAIGCGGFEEADNLIGCDLSAVTVVDSRPDVIERARAKHRQQIVAEHCDPALYLDGALKRGDRFDVIYSLSIAETMDDGALSQWLRLARVTLRPGGVVVVANLIDDVRVHGYADIAMGRSEPVLRDRARLNAVAGADGATTCIWSDTSGLTQYLLVGNSGVRLRWADDPFATHSRPHSAPLPGLPRPFAAHLPAGM